MRSLADDAAGDQEPEQDTRPGGEAEDVFPAAILLADDPLAGHLKGTGHGHGAGGGPNQRGHDRGGPMAGEDLDS